MNDLLNWSAVGEKLHLTHDLIQNKRETSGKHKKEQMQQMMLENPGRKLRTFPASSDNLHISEGPTGTLLEVHNPGPHYFISGPSTLERLSVVKRPARHVTARGRSMTEL